jgi:flavorubredoxin
MRARKVIDGVTWVGSVDWDRQLFDELIPLPDGTSYNAYLLTGSEKTALIDTVDPAKTDEWRGLLDAAGISKIDYVIANHAEQDHAGSIPYILQRFPAAQLVCTPKAKGLAHGPPACRERPLRDGGGWSNFVPGRYDA